MASRLLTIEAEAGPVAVCFMQPQGLEKIRLDKHLAKGGGRPEIAFEGLHAGWSVKVCFYAQIGVISELTVLSH